MSYMQCQKCGGMFGVIGRVVYTCGCVPPIPIPVTEVIEETIVAETPHPGLGSGALWEVLKQIASITCSCHDSADANWHGNRCPKGIALAALSLSSPIEPPPNVATNLLRKWRDYAEEMRKGKAWIVSAESRDLLKLQVEMAERFIRDLETL